MFGEKKIIGGLLAGLLGLFYLRKHFAGGKCTITKDLTNHIAVITGGNTGIGRETARCLAEMGCTVIIGARDQEKSQKFVQEMAYCKGKVIAFKLDLSVRTSIESFVSCVNKQLNGRPLNYLINNAGILALPQRKETKQGFEMQIAVNYFGHFYLTYLLWDSLKKSGNPRIINVSSRAHRTRAQWPDIDFDNLHYEKGGYNPWKAYSHSKKATILFTKELQKKMKQEKINGVTISLHPGVVRTQISRDMADTFLKRTVLNLLTPFSYIFMKSSLEGAQTTLYALLEQSSNLKSGQYYVDCKPSPLLSKQCQSPEAAKKLWQVTEKQLGITFKL